MKPAFYFSRSQRGNLCCDYWQVGRRFTLISLHRRRSMFFRRQRCRGSPRLTSKIFEPRMVQNCQGQKPGVARLDVLFGASQNSSLDRKTVDRSCPDSASSQFKIGIGLWPESPENPRHPRLRIPPTRGGKRCALCPHRKATSASAPCRRSLGG
jgi:hypothetical protein